MGLGWLNRAAPAARGVLAAPTAVAITSPAGGGDNSVRYRIASTPSEGVSNALRRGVRGALDAVRARHPPAATRGAGEGASTRGNAGSAVVA